MGYNGPVRFYLVNGGGIYPSEFVAKSPYAIVEKDWRDALPELARKYPLRGEGLEVDCHGAPGMLLLHPQVTFYSLYEFADRVRGLLQPGGRVEFLACRVASFDAFALARRWKNSFGRDSERELLENWTCTRESYDMDEGRGGDGRLDRDYRFRTAAPKHLSPDKMDYTRIAEMAIATREVRIGGGWNGPLFCSRAAQVLFCTVRASMATQQSHMTSYMGEQEFLNTPDYQVQPDGNWRGHVFDFGPSGTVKYVGLNVPRPVFVPMTPETNGMC